MKKNSVSIIDSMICLVCGDKVYTREELLEYIKAKEENNKAMENNNETN